MDTNTRTVLIADDDRQILALWKLAFEQHGYRVLLAGNGHGVLKHLASEPVDVVLLDVLMPEKDGLETLVEIREHCANLAVIMVSGGGAWGKHDFLGLAKELGATAVFQKPTLLRDMIKRIDELLEPRAFAKRLANAGVQRTMDRRSNQI